MTTAAGNRAPGEPRRGRSRDLTIAACLTPLALIANFVIIAGMGLTTDDPNNVLRPFNRLGHVVDAATAVELAALCVAVVASRFGPRGAVLARWSARVAIVVSVALLALLVWLLA